MFLKHSNTEFSNGYKKRKEICSELKCAVFFDIWKSSSFCAVDDKNEMEKWKKKNPLF